MMINTQILNKFIDNMNKISVYSQSIFILISSINNQNYLSYSEIQKRTGIKSHNTIKKAILELEKNNFIIIYKEKFGYRYEVK